MHMHTKVTLLLTLAETVAPGSLALPFELTRGEAVIHLKHHAYLLLQGGHLNYWGGHKQFTCYLQGTDGTPLISWRDVLKLIKANYPRKFPDMQEQVA
jgi:hypothetical protein